MKTEIEILIEWNKLNTLFNELIALREKGEVAPFDPRRALECRQVLDWINGDDSQSPSDSIRTEMGLK